MISIQVITHGKMAEGMIDSVDMILGDTENVVTNTLSRGQDIEEFQKIVLDTTNELLTDDGVLIFVDMFGATPFNTSMINSRDVESDAYKVIAGVNLPLLMEAISSRYQMNIDELYEHILQMKADSVQGWEK